MLKWSPLVLSILWILSVRSERSMLQQKNAFNIDGCPYAEAEIECNPNVQISVFILGGCTTRSDQYPFMISLQEERRDYGRLIPDCYKHFCGGSLILDDVVVTAAHCLRDFVDFSVKGIQKIDPRKVIYAVRESKCRHQEGIERLLVKEAFVHPDFEEQQQNYKNDIALLFVGGKFNKSSIINILNVTEFEQKAQKSYAATMLGFGYTALEQQDIFTTLPLKEAKTNIKIKNSCLAFLAADSKNESYWDQVLDTDTMVCTYGSKVNSCQGDSGGPLFFTTEKGEHILIGVISWGPIFACKSPSITQTPTISTKISYYKDWILEAISSKPDSNTSGLLQLPDATTVTTTPISPAPASAPTPTPIPIPTPTPPSLNTNLNEAFIPEKLQKCTDIQLERESAAGITGQDNRVDVQNTSCFPFSTIGEVQLVYQLTGLTVSCNGVMIASDIIITAGLCAWISSGLPTLSDMLLLFKLGDQTVQVIKTVVIDKQGILVDGDQNLLVNVSIYGEGLTLGKLSGPVGILSSGWMGLNTKQVQVNDQVILAGKQFDSQGRFTRQNCEVTGVENDFVKYNCDTFENMEGSAIFNSAFDLVAVHSSWANNSNFSIMISQKIAVAIQDAILQM